MKEDNDLIVLREASKTLSKYNLQLALKTIKIARNTYPDCHRTKKIQQNIESNFEYKSRQLTEIIYKSINNTKETIEHKKPIWFFWAQGYSAAPDVVRVAYDSWVKNNPSHKVIFIDNKKISDLLGFDLDDLIYINENINMGYAGKSDFLRILLLYKFGGIWVDSTSFCLKPVDNWLDISETGFFIFRQNEKCKDRSMVSWFMASEKKSELSKCLLMKSFDFLTEKKERYLITVSNNRIPEPSKELLSRTETGYKYLSHCENHGFIPYFWFFYLWNETRKENMDLVKKIERMDNNHSNLYDPIEKFLASNVSKNTYKITKENKKRLEARMDYMRKVNRK